MRFPIIRRETKRGQGTNQKSNQDNGKQTFERHSFKHGIPLDGIGGVRKV
jgi:hypothetical protein